MTTRLSTRLSPRYSVWEYAIGSLPGRPERRAFCAPVQVGSGLPYLAALCVARANCRVNLVAGYPTNVTEVRTDGAERIVDGRQTGIRQYVYTEVGPWRFEVKRRYWYSRELRTYGGEKRDYYKVVVFDGGSVSRNLVDGKVLTFLKVLLYWWRDRDIVTSESQDMRFFRQLMEFHKQNGMVP